MLLLQWMVIIAGDSKLIKLMGKVTVYGLAKMRPCTTPSKAQGTLLKNDVTSTLKPEERVGAVECRLLGMM